VKFRKKPVVIEAHQWDGSVPNAQLIVGWIQQGGAAASVSPGWHSVDRINIPTLEGTITAIAGDWIICGVKGEFYPCKPDIFAATYEEVNS